MARPRPAQEPGIVGISTDSRRHDKGLARFVAPGRDSGRALDFESAGSAPNVKAGHLGRPAAQLHTARASGLMDS